MFVAICAAEVWKSVRPLLERLVVVPLRCTPKFVAAVDTVTLLTVPPLRLATLRVFGVLLSRIERLVSWMTEFVEVRTVVPEASVLWLAGTPLTK